MMLCDQICMWLLLSFYNIKFLLIIFKHSNFPLHVTWHNNFQNQMFDLWTKNPKLKFHQNEKLFL